MSAQVYDDSKPGLVGTPDYRCSACGMNVRKVVAFDGYGKGWQACFDCIRDANVAADENDGRAPTVEDAQLWTGHELLADLKKHAHLFTPGDFERMLAEIQEERGDTDLGDKTADSDIHGDGDKHGDGDESEAVSQPEGTSTQETAKSTATAKRLDLRPRCCRCGERWIQPEGVDAQVVPCPACRRRDEMQVVVDGPEAASPTGDRERREAEAHEYVRVTDWVPGDLDADDIEVAHMAGAEAEASHSEARHHEEVERLRVEVLNETADAFAADARQVGMGDTFDGGPLHGASIYNVNMRTVRKLRELAEAHARLTDSEKETSTEPPTEVSSGPRRMAGREPYQEHAVIDGKRHKVYVCYNCNAETISNPLCTCGAFVRPLYGEESVLAKGIWCPVCGPIARATDHGGCPKCGCAPITDRVLCEIRAQVTLSGELDRRES